MNKIFFIAAFLAVSVLAIAPENRLFAAETAPAFRKDSLLIGTRNGDIPFDIEIAETPREQEYGYMNRANIPENHGMLFIFKRDIPIQMWMKNTPLSLDMLFIDKTGNIIHIAKNAEPNSLKIVSANRPTRAVLELLGGVSDKRGIKVGDVVKHPYFK